MPKDIERKLVFALAPSGTGDGVPLLVIGIPKGCWDYIKDGNTSHLDLTKVGLPVKLMLFGAESHDAAMKLIQQAAAQQGCALLDERQRDFSVKEFNK